MYYEPSIRTYNLAVNNQLVTIDVKPIFGSNPFWVQDFLQKITEKLSAELRPRSTGFTLSTHLVICGESEIQKNFE